jgi:hypothetical protein
MQIRTSSTDIRFIVFSFAIYYCMVFNFPYFSISGGDANDYLAIANGALSQVNQPFTGRALFAIWAGDLAHWAGFDVKYGFMVVAWASLVIFVTSLSAALRHVGASSWRWSTMVLTTAFMWRCFGTVEMPDAIATAAIILPLIALSRERWELTIGLAGIGLAVRETGLILVAFLIIAAFRQRRWTAIAVGLMATGIGALISSHYRAMGLGNIHEMSPLLYFAAKIPVNMLTEVFGIAFWTDSYSLWCSAPVIVTDLPHFLPSGHIHQIGICRPQSDLPLRNVFSLCTSFGILPAILWASRKQRLELPLWVRVALWYGLAMFFLGVVSGRSVARLVCYGWPAFVIAAPALAARTGLRVNRSEVILQAIIAVTAIAITDLELDRNIPPIVLAFCGIAAQVYGWFLLRSNRQNAHQPEMHSAQNPQQ